jgi:hypothetical protein
MEMTKIQDLKKNLEKRGELQNERTRKRRRNLQSHKDNNTYLTNQKYVI